MTGRLRQRTTVVAGHDRGTATDPRGAGGTSRDGCGACRMPSRRSLPTTTAWAMIRASTGPERPRRRADPRVRSEDRRAATPVGAAASARNHRMSSVDRSRRPTVVPRRQVRKAGPRKSSRSAPTPGGSMSAPTARPSAEPGWRGTAASSAGSRRRRGPGRGGRRRAMPRTKSMPRRRMRLVLGLRCARVGEADVAGTGITQGRASLCDGDQDLLGLKLRIELTPRHGRPAAVGTRSGDDMGEGVVLHGRIEGRVGEVDDIEQQRPGVGLGLRSRSGRAVTGIDRSRPNPDRFADRGTRWLVSPPWRSSPRST